VPTEVFREGMFQQLFKVRTRATLPARTVFAAVLFAVVCAWCPTAISGQEKPSQPASPDDACLACHGQPDLKSEKGQKLSIDPAKHAASAHGILSCRDCHTTIKDYPHPASVPQVKCSTCHADAAAGVPKSIHGRLGAQACASCHGDVHELNAAASLMPQKCAECHAQAVKEFAGSPHGQAARAGDRDAPSCASCHGPVHQIRSADKGDSVLAKRQIAAACVQCHGNQEFITRHKLPLARPVEQYLNSVHARAVAAGKNAATCTDCHGSHGIYSARDARSGVNHWNVAATCSKCHSEIAKTYLESVHGEAMQKGDHDAPVCTDCHGEHLIMAAKSPESPVSVKNVSSETCARCHGDARMAQRHGLPADRVPSYEDSYHGLAFREGSVRAANCVSCHGIHNIYRASDTRSTVNSANLPKTCGKCHQGVTAAALIGPVHVQTSSGPAHPAVLWIRRVYLVLIPLTLVAMLLHNFFDLVRKLKQRKYKQTVKQTVKQTAKQTVKQAVKQTVKQAVKQTVSFDVVRMNLWFRIAHWAVMFSFPILAYTGFALKYPEMWWARPLLRWEEHRSFRGGLHRVAAVALIAATLYHFIHLTVNRRDRAYLRALLPRWKDITDFIGSFLYNLGLTETEPRFGRFSYVEKLEYWAFLWGTLVMAVSGFWLWFNNFTLSHFPKWTSDAATAIHWYEALLATFSILLWHFYAVIFDPVVYPMDMAWLTGKVPADHYRHSRPAYYRALESAQNQQPAAENPKPAIPADPTTMSDPSGKSQA
jgi:cytochrome b subunit of formate dehydrogenase